MQNRALLNTLPCLLKLHCGSQMSLGKSQATALRTQEPFCVSSSSPRRAGHVHSAFPDKTQTADLCVLLDAAGPVLLLFLRRVPIALLPSLACSIPSGGFRFSTGRFPLSFRPPLTPSSTRKPSPLTFLPLPSLWAVCADRFPV